MVRRIVWENRKDKDVNFIAMCFGFNFCFKLQQQRHLVFDFVHALSLFINVII